MLPRPLWALAALWLLAAAEVRCPEPAPVDNSILVVEEAEGRLVVTFLCVSGHHLVGQKTLLCDGAGRWSAPAPTCRAGHCPDPAPENGESSPPGPAHVNDTVTFLCAEGLVLRGSGWSQCREDHAWRPPPPTCSSRDCGPPGSPPHGHVEGGFTSGSTVTYRCEERYQLVGAQQRRCVDGAWSGEPPECKRVPDTPETAAQAQLERALLAFQEEKEVCKAIAGFVQRLQAGGLVLEEARRYLQMKKLRLRPR